MTGWGPKLNNVPAAPAVAVVNSASVQVVAENPNRRGLLLINTDAAKKISFGLGTAAILGSGITLAPGAVWQMHDNDFWTGAVMAIASADGASLAIQEFS